MEHKTTKTKKKAKPQFDLIIGGVCTGKTYLRHLNYPTGYTHIDAGEIFIKLSKGKYYNFPSNLERPMNKVGFELAKKAIADRANIVMEVVGDDINDVSQLVDGLK